MSGSLPSIEFSSGFDAVICLDTDQPFNNYLSALNNPVIIAADGAAIRLLSQAIRPDYIIGDLDSLSPFMEEDILKGIEIIQDKDQETNDFQKCLVFAENTGFKNILVLGIHGGEMEHTLNNWSVFIRFAQRLNLCILDKNRYGLAIFQSFKMKTDPGELISLIPQPKTVLTTQNLHWKLTHEELSLGFRDGAHNIADKNEISIELHSGSLLLFIESRMPFSPSYSDIL